LSFSGNVKIDTKEKLKVGTEALSFDQNSGVASTDSPVSFERENVSGTSTGAVVEQKSKRLELKKDVQLTIAPTESMKSTSRLRPVTIKAGHGSFEQHTLQLVFAGGVTVDQDSDVLSGDNLTAFLNQQQRLERAVANTAVTARTLEGDSDVQITGSDSIEVTFHANNNDSLLKEMKAGGRSVVTMSAPKSKANDPRAANKRLTANEVKLT